MNEWVNNWMLKRSNIQSFISIVNFSSYRLNKNNWMILKSQVSRLYLVSKLKFFLTECVNSPS
jgi:hypothetical protein